MKTPLIFLDYDGVLTSTLETPGSYINHDVEEYGTSPKCLQRLLSLCNKTGAKIVITSNWRRFPPDGFWHRYDLVQVPNNLPKLKKILKDYLYGELPPDRHITKAKATELWLESHPEVDVSTQKYVIFDDDFKEKYQDSKFKEHFIKTDPELGLTDEDCRKAERMLT